MLGLRSDIRRLLAAADVFLLTSVSEGIPVTVLEAMAAGVPVVATAVGGLPELVTNEESGLLAPAVDAASLAAALVRLAADAQLRTQFARTGQQRAAQTSIQKLCFHSTIRCITKCFAPSHASDHDQPTNCRYTDVAERALRLSTG